MALHTEEDTRPEDLRALRAAARLGEGHPLTIRLKGLVGSDHLGSLIATTAQAEALLEIKAMPMMPDEAERAGQMEEQDDPAQMSDEAILAEIPNAQGDRLAQLQAEADKRHLDVGTKAMWDTAYQNNLPDSAFLYIAPGGSKDSDGKTTPRSLRYFPVRDDSGAVDIAHVRNALARIPQSGVPQAVKDSCIARARKLLGNVQKALVIVAEMDEEDNED